MHGKLPLLDPELKADAEQQRLNQLEHEFMLQLERQHADYFDLEE